jgi:cell division protein FtsL
MTRTAWIIGLVVAALLVVSLYRAKYGARESAAQERALKKEIVALEEDIRALRNEVSGRTNLVWIEEYARSVLGMGPPRAEAIMTPGEVAAYASAHAEAAALAGAIDGAPARPEGGADGNP